MPAWPAGRVSAGSRPSPPDVSCGAPARPRGATRVAPGGVDGVLGGGGRSTTFGTGLPLLRTGGTRVLIGLSPAGETALVELPRLFARRARIVVSHGGDHLPSEDF